MTISKQELRDQLINLRKQGKIAEANALIDQYDNQNSGVSAGNQVPLEEPYTPESDDTGVTSLLKGGLRGVAALPQAVLEGGGAVSKFLGGDTLGTGIDNLAGAIGKFRGHLDEDIAASNNPNLGAVGDFVGQAIPTILAPELIAARFFNKPLIKPALQGLGKFVDKVFPGRALTRATTELNKAKTEETKANTALKEQELINKPLSNEAQINLTNARTKDLENKALKAEQNLRVVENNPKATPKQRDEARQDLDRANAELARQKAEYVKQQTQHYGTTVENKTNLNNAQVGNLNARTDFTRNQIAANEESAPFKNDYLKAQTRNKEAATRKVEADIKTKELTDEYYRLRNERIEAENRGIVDKQTLDKLRAEELEAKNRLVEQHLANNEIKNSLTTSQKELNEANTRLTEANTRLKNLQADALEQNLGNPTGTGTTGTGGATNTAELAETVGNTAETLTPEAGVNAAESAGTGNVANTASETATTPAPISTRSEPLPALAKDPEAPSYRLFLEGKHQNINRPRNDDEALGLLRRGVNALNKLKKPEKVQTGKIVENNRYREETITEILKDIYNRYVKEVPAGSNEPTRNSVIDLARELTNDFNKFAQNSSRASNISKQGVSEIETLANELTTSKPNPSPQIAKKPAIKKARKSLYSAVEEFNANKPIEAQILEEYPRLEGQSNPMASALEDFNTNKPSVPATVPKPNALSSDLSSKYTYEKLVNNKKPKVITERANFTVGEKPSTDRELLNPVIIHEGKKVRLAKPQNAEEVFEILSAVRNSLQKAKDIYEKYPTKDLIKKTDDILKGDLTRSERNKAITQATLTRNKRYALFYDYTSGPSRIIEDVVKGYLKNNLKNNPDEFLTFSRIIKDIYEKDFFPITKEMKELDESGYINTYGGGDGIKFYEKFKNTQKGNTLSNESKSALKVIEELLDDHAPK